MVWVKRMVGVWGWVEWNRGSRVGESRVSEGQGVVGGLGVVGSRGGGQEGRGVVGVYI